MNDSNSAKLREQYKYEVELNEDMPDGSLYYRYFENFLKYRYAKPAFEELIVLIEQGVHGDGKMTLSISNMDGSVEDEVNQILRFENCRRIEE
ncbi:MAG: hypothetical protein LBQ96_07910 [Fusobacteriaceae bacterium]|nr:hypothetical protein [Fusobacteriaceae bacterium]